MTPGVSTQVAQHEGFQIGLSVCYDLRFPELYRALINDGATILTVPAAFTLQTGKDHWDVLRRARAIENQAACHRTESVGEPWQGPCILGQDPDYRSLGDLSRAGR